MNIKIIFLILAIILFSCNKDDDSQNNSTSKGIPIYNQAYQENYESDRIEDILNDAHSAYVLIDPFQEGISNQVTAIKASNNQVGAYISIGTGENWRADFNELQPFLVGTVWGEWEGEYFVNNTNTGILEVMKSRIDKIATWGCDWV